MTGGSINQPEIAKAAAPTAQAAHIPAPDDPVRAEIQKEIDGVYATINEDQGEYDKQLLTLSSGFLAVSLAFIKDIVPLKDAELLWILYSSFSLLALCIILVLFSYQFSIAGLFKAKEYWDELLEGKKDAVFPYGYSRHIKFVNRISGFSFLLGVCSLVLFVILNLNHQAGVARTTVGANLKVQSGGEAVENGLRIKTPPPPPAAQGPSSGGSGTKNQPGR